MAFGIYSGCICVLRLRLSFLFRFYCVRLTFSVSYVFLSTFSYDCIFCFYLLCTKVVLSLEREETDLLKIVFQRVVGFVWKEGGGGGACFIGGVLCTK